MAVIRTPWNQYEIALLIDTYFQIKEGKLSRKDAVARLSKRLRAKAIAEGGVIAEQYRNENGMEMQLAAMAYALTDGAEGKEGASVAFRKAAVEYHVNNQQYLHTLMLAERLYPVARYDLSSQIKSDERKSEIPLKQQKETQADNIIPKVVECIRFNHISTKTVRKVLEEKFSKPFRLDSAIELKRYKRFHEEMYGKPANVDDEELLEIIQECGIVNDNKVYLPENILSAVNREKIIGYIEELFKDGGTFIYYNALLEHFEDMFLDSMITDRQGLKNYLEHFDKHRWFYNTFYVAKNSRIEPNLDELVITYLKMEGDAVEDETVYEAIPYNTKDQVRRVLNYNPDVIISTGREGKHFHIDSFHISDKAKSGIRDIICKLLTDSSFTTYDELSKHIKINYPEVMKDNAHLSDLGIRHALKAIYAKRYTFNNNIISKKGQSLDSYDIFRNFCKTNERFTIDEIENLAAEFNTLLPFEILLEKSIRINHDEYVSQKAISFDFIAIDNALDGMLGDKEFVGIGTISNFTSFPHCIVPWTEYLLESYLELKSDKFKLLHNRFLKDSVTGAVVRKSSSIESYDEIMIEAVAKSRTPLNEKDILDFLQSEKYIARRNKKILKELNIVERATKLRNRN